METRAARERGRRTGESLLAEPVLFSTVHGSRLYGLSHSGSDYDTYVVVAEPRGHSETLQPRRTLHAVVTQEDGTVTDVTTTGLTWFLHLCNEGAPMSLEAMFAPTAETDTFAAYRAAYRVNPHTMTATYRRSMTEHALRGLGLHPTKPTNAPHKVRRHAVRQALNLATALETGRFNPVLTADEKHTVLTVADSATFVADLRVLTAGMVDLANDRVVLAAR